MTKKNGQYTIPRVNVIEHPDTVLIEAELPGVAKDGVELEAKEGQLTLVGRRKSPNGIEGARHVVERSRLDYRREFTLSRAIDPSKVEAEMKDGVLKITLHKAEAMKPRKIAIK